jgi:LysM repeat protein
LDSVKFDTKASDARFSNTVRVVAVSKRNADSLDDQKGAEEKLKRYAKVLVNAVVAQNNQTGERLVALPTVEAVKELQARVSSEAAAKQLPPNLQPLTDITESKQWVDSNLAFATVEEAYAFLSGGKLPVALAPVAPVPVAPVQADDNTAPPAPVKPAPQPVVTPVKPAKPTVTPAPAPVAGGTYTVKEGDTAWGVCKRLKVSLSTLEKLNPGVNLDILKPGDKLNLPGGAN